jgi:hypothetical protein
MRVYRTRQWSGGGDRTPGSADGKQRWGTYAMFKDSEGNRFVVASD